MNNKTFFTLGIVLLVFTEVTGQSPAAKINELIYPISSFPEPSPTAKQVLQEREVEDPESHVKCKEKTVQLTEKYDQIVTFHDIPDLYPGSVVQGKFLQQGKVTSIGNFSRKSITLTVTGLDLGSKMNSQRVEKPGKATVTETITTMVRDYQGDTENKFSFKKVEAYSKQQALAELGINAKFWGGGIGGSLNVSSKSNSSTIFIYFKQKYYSVSMEPPTGPSDFFSDDVNLENLKYRIGEGNPPGYISSVTYGRLLIAKMTSNYSREQMEAAVNAKFGLGVVKGSLEASSQEILINSTYEVYASGGVVQSVPDRIEGIEDFINTGMHFEKSTQAVPIAFEVRYLTDNSIMALGDETQYTVRDCFDNTPSRRYRVFVKGLYVHYDCDDGFMTDTGPGEFVYRITVNEKEEFRGNKNVNDGNWIEINQERIVEVDYAPGSSISLNINVTEKDEMTNDEILANGTLIEHNYPFNPDNFCGRYKDKWCKERLSGNGNCLADLYYYIEEMK